MLVSLTVCDYQITTTITDVHGTVWTLIRCRTVFCSLVGAGGALISAAVCAG